ncbi:class I SAM-dependent methyltransferase [Amycolatopsis methanolica]|uniref:class I SAM-dependent methyltransferase n=1 Tax=Amycolatopsis methanolica TaxID=1814 RepID=UPI003431AA5D
MPTVRHAASLARAAWHRGLATIGLTHSERRISADAQSYWAQPADEDWKDNSHWADGPVFGNSDLWREIGRRHLELFHRGARLAEFTRPWDRIVEWGCGGGANAIHFAPRARQEFVGIDISADSLIECERQVKEVCDTPFRGLEIDITDPEAVLRQITEPCDIFLCLYVFEVLPTPEYGHRVLRLAHQMLAPGGLALVQIKYDDGRWVSKPRRRAYKSGISQMTTYPIAGFWQLAERCGFQPQGIELVPQNELDDRYAYFFLSK